MIRQLLFAIFLAATVNASAATYAELREQARDALAEKSYSLALRTLQQMATLEGLNTEQSRWLRFQQANAGWRELAAAGSADAMKMNAFRDELNQLAAGISKKTPGQRPPQIWADIQKSLGDSWWLSPQQDWNQAWKHYQQALDWWAGSTELDTARSAYLGILRDIATAEQSTSWRWRQVGVTNGLSRVPVETLENAARIARSKRDRAWAQAQLGMQFIDGGTDLNTARKTFETALAETADSRWEPAVLYAYAQWNERFGDAFYDEYGNLQPKPDFAKALELYRKLQEFVAKGESPFFSEAQERIEQITRQELNIGVSHTFRPGQELSLMLTWRNVSGVTVSVYPVDPSTQIQAPDNRDWAEAVSLDGVESVETFSEGAPNEPYQRENKLLKIDGGLDAGLYLVEAQGGGESSRSFLVVTQASLLAQAGETLLAFTARADSGEPIEGSRIHLWESVYRNRDWSHSKSGAKTGEDGLARLEGRGEEASRQIFVIAETAFGPAMARLSGYYHRDRDIAKVYAFTDRPAYRPEETVHWKITARSGSDNAYRVPAQESLQIRIVDARGNEIYRGEHTLNSFGSAWGSLELSEEMALGMARVEFSRKGKWLAGSELFRIEEYKLPEYQVELSAKGPDGAGTAFRLGDELTIEVDAQYYFGGPVADAEVELVVRERDFRFWWPVRGFGHFFDDGSEASRHFNRGNEIKRESAKTNAEGNVTFTLETPPRGNNREYIFEARVTDASRREILGNATVRVTKEPYFVNLSPSQRVAQPGETIDVAIRSRNANGDPVSVQGEIVLAREEWQERWMNLATAEVVSGSKREQLIAAGELQPWQFRELAKGYEQTTIAKSIVSTDEDGEGSFTFSPGETGYYKVYWVSRPEKTAPVTAETAVWCATEDTRSLGYHGGLEIIADAEGFRAGQPGHLMLSADQSGLTVLLTVIADGILETRVVALEGDAKLLRFDVNEQWVPNVSVSADSFIDYDHRSAREEILVPPVDHFLDVEVTSNSAVYQPGESGTLNVLARNQDGQPVSAEVALALVDESVFYIQPEIAPDPRQFFYGQKRNTYLPRGTSLQMKPFAPIEKETFASIQQEEREEMLGSIDEVWRSGEFGDQRENVSHFGMRASGDSLGSSDPFAPRAMAAPAAAMEMDAARSGEAPAPEVVVRSDFRSTVFWQPDVKTNENGRASVEVTFPDNTTSWQASARAVALPTKVGQSTTSMKTRLPLIARLQHPRFLTVGDTATIAGVITNNTDAALDVTAELAADGLSLDGETRRAVRVEAGQSGRIDWTVAAKEFGEAKLILKAWSGDFSDGMEKTLPVHEYGIDKFLATSGKLVSAERTATLDLPPFKAGTMNFEVHVTPSLALMMLDALPYLAQYPYGCTEQTMSRFLPAVIVNKTLNDLGVDRATVLETAFGSNVDTSAKGQLDELDQMIEKGVERLRDFQHSDGGWGWWKGDRSDFYMTGYVVWGLSLAKRSGVEFEPAMLERGKKFLRENLVNAERQYDRQAWMLHALASDSFGQNGQGPGRFEAQAFANLFKNRDQLNSFSRALLTISGVAYGLQEEAAMLARNLENGVKRDQSPQSSTLQPGTGQAGGLPTAHWGESGRYYRWSNGGIEATAFGLMALLYTDPENELVEPAINWLVQNRRGARWTNTRDTAISIMALTLAMETQGLLDASGQFSIEVNGSPVGAFSVTPDSLFRAPRVFEVPAGAVKTGANQIVFRRSSGSAPLYFSARADFFTQEEPIAPAGNDIFIARDFFRVVPQETLLEGTREKLVPMEAGDRVESGDRLEVRLRIEAKNDLEYLVFEDLKAAGLEAVAIRSGGNVSARQFRPDASEENRYTGTAQYVHQELRDRKVASFISRLPQGFWEIRYQLRAETPGTYSALPALGHAMYNPEVRTNSASVTVEIDD